MPDKKTMCSKKKYYLGIMDICQMNKNLLIKDNSHKSIVSDLTLTCIFNKKNLRL